MTSFGWKRKLGEKICKQKVQKFSSDSKDDEDESEDIDWLNLAPARKAICIEDALSKSERLKKEGIVLAEAERFWEAITKWNEALQLTPTNESLMEMKVQALLSVGEVLPALQAANKTVELAPKWWVAHQTLGRAQINIGEVKMALKSFSRAIHFNPSEEELWREDLIWTQSLLAGRETASNSNSASVTNKPENKTTLSIKELKAELSIGQEYEEETLNDNLNELVPYASVANNKDNDSELEGHVEASLVHIPANYVHMRDPT